MAAPRPGNAERGWNDPPMFDFVSSSGAQSSPRRTQLNKRVAFPATTNKTEECSKGALFNPENGPPMSPIQLLPPMTNTATPAPVPLLIPSLGTTPPPKSSGVIPLLQQVETLSIEDVLETLKLSDDTKLMEHIKCSLQKEFENGLIKKSQGRTKEDFKRKMQIFHDSWTHNKLSNAVKVKTWQITQAIEDGDYDKAWSLHLLLMVDHTSEVNQWLVAIKKIIHEARETKYEKDTESNSKNNDQDVKSDSTRHETTHTDSYISDQDTETKPDESNSVTKTTQAESSSNDNTTAKQTMCSVLHPEGTSVDGDS